MALNCFLFHHVQLIPGHIQPYPVGEMTPPSTGPPCSGPPPPVFGQLTKAEMLAIVKEQALSKQKKKDSPARTFQEQIKFYATFSFSLIAISGFSVLMFLVPFIVDPALATLTADFVEKPVECRVTFSKAILGKKTKVLKVAISRATDESIQLIYTKSIDEES